MNTSQTVEAGTTVSVDGHRSHESNPGGTTQHTGTTPETTGTKITKARTTSGFPRIGAAITEDCIVKVNGIEGRIKDMMAVGRLQRLPDGSFAVPDSTPTQDTDKAAPESSQESPAALSNSIEASITEVAQGASAGDVMSLIHSYATHGGFNENALGHVASQMGIEPEAARDRANSIRTAFEAQARATVEAQGLDSNEVFNWAHQHHPEMFKTAILNQATRRTIQGYQDIAAKYVASMDTANPDAILNAKFADGITASKARDGKIMIHTPKGDFEWKALVKMGRVSIGKNR